MDHHMDLRNLRDPDSLCCLSLLFAGGGIAGWIYEMLFYRINDGMFVERGQGLGPWLPIYGFGSVLICLLASRFEKSKSAVFLVSAAVSGIIGGYVCLRSVLLFAFAGVFLTYICVPMISRISCKIPKTLFYLIGFVPGALFIIDILGGYILRLW